MIVYWRASVGGASGDGGVGTTKCEYDATTGTDAEHDTTVAGGPRLAACSLFANKSVLYM